MAWDFRSYQLELRIRAVKGDIVVCQEFSNYPRKQGSGAKDKDQGKERDLFYIRTGQAIGSWMIKSSSNSEHAAIVMKGWDATTLAAAKICDANVNEGHDGIWIRPWRPRPAYLYRCNDAQLRNEAACAAGRLARKVKLGIATGGTYNWIAAKNSVTKFKYVNADSNTFVNNCYAVAYDAPAVGDADNLPGMFCSEFVTVCYLLAAKKKNINLGNMNVDPRAISPKALQSLLERSMLFTRMGRPFCDGT